MRHRSHVATGLSIPVELMDRIDSERGDISRSRYLQRLLEKAYNKEEINKEADR